MAKTHVEKSWFEDFKLGKARMKCRRPPSNDPRGLKWSFFGKGGLTAWLTKKASKKAGYAPKTWNQRSIAKVSYLKNSYKGQWGVHGRYLSRQGTQLENAPGLGFDAQDEDLNISKTLRTWQAAGDPKLWKIILSPEMAHKLDLKAHVRAVMGQVERDLGTGLEWVAVAHYNTDNFHAHIVLRGVDKEGKELRLDNKYLMQGFRQRSIEEATRALGLRLSQDVLLKRQENIKSMHITEMDREIKQRLTKDNFLVLAANPKGAFMDTKELQLKGRLMHLESLGLAKKDSNASWRVDPGFIDYLKFVQTQQDIVKTKNRHIKDVLSPTLPVVVNKLDKPGEAIIGRIVGMGLSEDRTEPRYMLIEGIDNKIHYVLVDAGVTKKRDGGDLRNGEIIYLERKEKFFFAESFRSFSEIEETRRLTKIDLFILDKYRENQHIPRAQHGDGQVRAQFINLTRNRIDLMKKVNIIHWSYGQWQINEPKLEWTSHFDLRLERGPRLRLGGPKL